MKITNTRLATNEVHTLLQETSSLFTPPLSESIDLEAYSKKLSEYANFVLCQDTANNNIAAFVAYYKNEQRKQLYIPLICVKQDYQRHGLATKMLYNLEISMGGGINI